MPILTVEIVLRPNEVVSPTLAADCAESAAAVFDSPLGHCWVRLRLTPTEHCAENGGGPPPGVYPVFVTVLHIHLPEGEALAEEARRLAVALAGPCDRPSENVQILYLPEGAGRMAIGGRLMG